MSNNKSTVNQNEEITKPTATKLSLSTSSSTSFPSRVMSTGYDIPSDKSEPKSISSLNANSKIFIPKSKLSVSSTIETVDKKSEPVLEINSQPNKFQQTKTSLNNQIPNMKPTYPINSTQIPPHMSK